MIWYLKQLVSARIARATLGISIGAHYDPMDPEHIARKKWSYTDPLYVIPDSYLSR